MADHYIPYAFCIDWMSEAIPATSSRAAQTHSGIRTAANTGNKQRVEAVKQAITNAIEAGEIPLETQELFESSW